MPNSLLRSLFLIPLISLFTNAQAQIPAIRWQHCYGGSQYDQANQIIPANDGGYWVVGQTYSSDGDVPDAYYGVVIKSNMLIMKIGRVGTKRYVLSRGGYEDDVAYAAATTTNGDLIVAGYSFSNDNNVGSNNRGSADAWVLRFDNSNAGLAWSRTFGGTGFDAFYGITTTPDGGCLLTGETSSATDDVSGNHGGKDAWLLKLDQYGQKQWQRCLGGSGQDLGRTIRPANDGGYILAGYTESNNGDVSGNHGGGDIWVVALTSNGLTRWQRCYGGSGADGFNGPTNLDIVSLADSSGYQLASSTRSGDGDVSGNLFAGSQQAWTLRLTNAGQPVSQRCLGGSSADVFEAIVRMPDGGFTMAGFTSSSDGDVTKPHSSVDADMWLVRLDANGQFLGQKSIGSSGLETAHSLVVTPEGTLIAAGSASVNDGDVSGLHHSVDAWVVELGKPAEAATAQLVACYPFSGDPRDRISINHGTVNQATLTTDRFGTPNSAYAFNGTNSFIDLGANVFRNDSYTLTAWVKPASPFIYSGTILSVGGPDGFQELILANNGDGQGLRWWATSYGATDPETYITSLENTTLNNWHQIVMTRTDKILRFFADGRLIDEIRVKSAVPAYTTDSRATVGARAGLREYFNGSIDDVQVYKGALTEDEASALYQTAAECPNFPVQTVDLSLAMAVDTRTPMLNQPANISLFVRNDGSKPATNVQVTSRLPANLQFIAANGLTNTAGTLSGMISRIESGTEAVLTYSVLPVTAGRFVLAAEVSNADQTDPDSQPNTGTADGQDDATQIDFRTTQVSELIFSSPNPNQIVLAPLQSNQPAPDPAKADLSLQMTVDNRTPKVGDTVLFTITIANRGGLEASGVAVSVLLPTGLSLVASPGVSQNGTLLRVPLDSVAVNNTTTARFMAQVTGTDLLIIKGEISQSAQGDSDSTPNNGFENGEDDTARLDIRTR